MSLSEQSKNLPDTAVPDTAVERISSEDDGQDTNCANREVKLIPPSTKASKSNTDDMEVETEVSTASPERSEAREILQEEDVAEEGGIGLEAQLQSLTTYPTAQRAPTNTTEGSSQDARPDAHHPAELMSEDYLDPTPKTPRVGVSPSRAPHDESKTTGESNPDSEIQSIMEQFGKGDEVEGEEDRWNETKLQLSAPLQHPPRRSSLVPVEAIRPGAIHDNSSVEANGKDSQISVKEIIHPNRHSSLPQAARVGAVQDAVARSPGSPMSLSKVPPPAPDPEFDLPFDFHRFLEQLRDKSADPVAKYLRSFLIEFGRKQWMVHEQVKLISDFLAFITNKMGRCAVWRDVTDAEFDNAKEGMEKLVMNRLYAQTFSPAIPPPAPAPTPKGKRKNIEKSLETGRRGQHQEDIERDEILGQKVRIYGWIQEEHLDIPPVGDSGRRFLILAQQELLKIKTYRAPRDKIICVLNCCKVIFGILRNSKSSDTSADSFVPLLIYVVLHANPDHLVSNVQYILRFRNQDKLGGEAGYYLSSLMGAIQFIENLDRTSLTVSDEEFEKNVEAAVSAIAEKHQENSPALATPRPQPPRAPTAGHLSEKSGPSMPEVIPRNSIDAEYSSPHKSFPLRGRSGEFGEGGSEDNTAVSGLLRSIQKPLSSIGRMFADDPAPGSTPDHPSLPSESQPPPRLSPAVFQPPRRSEDMDGSAERPQNFQAGRRPSTLPPNPDPNGGRTRKLSAEDAAARQASAEAAEAQRIQRAEHQNIVELVHSCLVREPS